MPIFSIGERRVELRGEHHYIAPDATIIGSVVLEAEVNVWFKVVIRADNDRITIGAGSNIQDGSVLHVDPGYPMRLGRMVSVGHKVMVHGSPGKIVRKLKPDDKDYLLGIARGYVERARFYKQNLREQ